MGMNMKFNFVSTLLTIALVAVAVGWVVSEYRHAERLELIRIESERDLRREEIYALRSILVSKTAMLTIGQIYENYTFGIALSLISDFERLAIACKTTDTKFFEEDCFAAGKILYYIGWDCSTPDELRANLNEFALRTNNNPPPFLTNEFAAKVLEVKSKLRQEMGSAAPQSPLTAGFYKQDDQWRQQ